MGVMVSEVYDAFLPGPFPILCPWDGDGRCNGTSAGRKMQDGDGSRWLRSAPVDGIGPQYVVVGPFCSR